MQHCNTYERECESPNQLWLLVQRPAPSLMDLWLCQIAEYTRQSPVAVIWRAWFQSAAFFSFLCLEVIYIVEFDCFTRSLSSHILVRRWEFILAIYILFVGCSETFEFKLRGVQAVIFCVFWIGLHVSCVMWIHTGHCARELVSFTWKYFHLTSFGFVLTVTIEKCRGDLKLPNTRMLHQRCPNLMSGSEISALVPIKSMDRSSRPQHHSWPLMLM